MLWAFVLAQQEVESLFLFSGFLAFLFCCRFSCSHWQGKALLCWWVEEEKEKSGLQWRVMVFQGLIWRRNPVVVEVLKTFTVRIVPRRTSLSLPGLFLLLGELLMINALGIAYYYYYFKKENNWTYLFFQLMYFNYIFWFCSVGFRCSLYIYIIDGLFFIILLGSILVFSQFDSSVFVIFSFSNTSILLFVLC